MGVDKALDGVNRAMARFIEAYGGDAQPARGTLEEMAELLQQMAVAQAVSDALDESDAESAAAVR